MKIKNDQVAIQCCTKHWKMMEQALTDRGMDHLVSNSGEKAEKVFKDAEGQPWEMTDPLLEAFTMQAAQTMNNGIPPDKVDEIAGKYICPVCLAMKLTNKEPESTETYWTGGLADFLLGEYRERGLLPRLQ